MRKEDLIDAMGEIEDKYVVEAEEIRFSKRKKTRRTMRNLTSLAACLCVLVIGGFVLSKQNWSDGGETSGEGMDTMDGIEESAENFTDEATEATDGAGGTEDDSIDEAGGTEDDSTDEEAEAEVESSGAVAENAVDYSPYFKNDASAQIQADYTLEAGGSNYNFARMEQLPEMPFDMSLFTAGSMDVYNNNEEKPENLYLSYQNEETEKYLGITLSESGKYFACYDLDLAEGVERYGVEVYGYDRSANSDTTSLEVYFTREGVAYNLSSSGLSQEELGAIMDAILQNGIDPEQFDYTKAVKKNSTSSIVSMEEMNQKEAFRGEIPVVDSVGDLELQQNGSNYFVNYEDEIVASEEYDIEYSNKDIDYITVSFQTRPNLEGEQVCERAELTREKMELYGNDSDTDENQWYWFFIDCEGYGIQITANCTSEELWSYLSQLP